MIKNCQGCNEDLKAAYEYQQYENLYLATTPDDKTTYPNNKGHFHIMMVDNHGKIRVS